MSQPISPPTGIPGYLAIEELNDLVYVFDRQLRLFYINETACRILGYAREELLARSAAIIGAEDPGPRGPGRGGVPGWRIGEQYIAETSLRSRAGRVIPVEISVRVIEHAGEPLRVVVARDLGERRRVEERASARLGKLRKRMESELAARAREFHTLVDNLPDVVVRYDLQLRRTYVNPAFHAEHGTTDQDVLGKYAGEGSRLTQSSVTALQELLRQTFATRVPCDHEFSLPAEDGKIFYWHLRVIPELDDNRAVTSLLTVWSEVTERKHLLASLDRMAYHDALTGIANRALLIERLTGAVRAAEHRCDALALLFIDLDGFKAVNDRWGHEAGDAVLVATAQRLQSVVCAADTVARFGGDEFVIVLGEPSGAAALTGLMDRVTKTITEPIIWKGTLLRIGASVGLARYPEDGLDAHSLLQRADESMYCEKARRRSRAGR
jgi:diguanylate cyclase (GGDEF)-like protein/PAS domain S-box-containing protein